MSIHFAGFKGYNNFSHGISKNVRGKLDPWEHKSINNLFLVNFCVILRGVRVCHVLRVLVIRLFPYRAGKWYPLCWNGTSRGLVRFSCDKCNYKVSHWYAFAVSWKSSYWNTPNLAVKARYSLAFSVKFSIKSERFHPYRG